MKAPLAAVALAFALAMPGLTPAAFAQDNPPTLSANGTGTEYAAPDLAIITLGVVSRADTARAALDANSTEMEKVIQAVRGEAIADKDIATTGFSINPVYSQPPRQPLDQPFEQQIIAYQVTNNVRIVVRDLDKTGTVLDRAVTSGANQAGSINFDIDDRQDLADKAIAAAIADAKRKAELMAGAADVRLVRVLNVNANENGGRPVMMRAEAFDAAAAPPVPVMGGELTISASASISWEIAPK